MAAGVSYSLCMGAQLVYGIEAWYIRISCFYEPGALSCTHFVRIHLHLFAPIFKVEIGIFYEEIVIIMFDF